MSDLTFIEKQKLEKLLGMETGYVLGFTDRSFTEFIAEHTRKNIYDPLYARGSGSKANRLRAFWDKEPNYLVGKLVSGLLDCLRLSKGTYSKPLTVDEAELYEECQRIAKRLQQCAPILELDLIAPGSGGKDFELLANSVRDSIDKNKPEEGLDRLHAFVLKYIRVVCNNHGIQADEEKPLHSLLGEYTKHLKKEGLIESGMTERILKSSISVLEAFNDVRNNRSLAHPNPVLNYDESLLIFNNVASTIRFIRSLEEKGHKRAPGSAEPQVEDNDLPF